MPKPHGRAGHVTWAGFGADGGACIAAGIAVASMMQGRRVVLAIVAGVVAISTGVGATVPILLPEISRPRLLFSVPLPATTLGYAAYGGLTTAIVLGVGVLAIEAASRAEET